MGVNTWERLRYGREERPGTVDNDHARWSGLPIQRWSKRESQPRQCYVRTFGHTSVWSGQQFASFRINLEYSEQSQSSVACKGNDFQGHVSSLCSSATCAGGRGEKPSESMGPPERGHPVF